MDVGRNAIGAFVLSLLFWTGSIAGLYYLVVHYINKMSDQKHPLPFPFLASIAIGLGATVATLLEIWIVLAVWPR